MFNVLDSDPKDLWIKFKYCFRQAKVIGILLAVAYSPIVIAEIPKWPKDYHMIYVILSIIEFAIVFFCLGTFFAVIFLAWWYKKHDFPDDLYQGKDGFEEL